MCSVFAEPAARALAARLALALLVAAALPARAQHGVADVVYVPTPQIVVDTMLRMARVGPRDYVIDLGSGDGRVVITAAKLGARALGVELDRFLLNQARDTALKEGVAERAVFREQNLFETDVGEATVITTYLLPEMNLKLRPKILGLKPGTRVVAHDYHMGDWYPDEREELRVPEKKVGNPGISYIYLWHVPASVEGVWRGQGPDGPWELALKQRFQYFSGMVRSGGASYRLDEGRLRGEEIRFALHGPSGEQQDYMGRVQGAEMVGKVTLRRGNRTVERPWQAQLSR